MIVCTHHLVTSHHRRTQGAEALILTLVCGKVSKAEGNHQGISLERNSKLQHHGINSKVLNFLKFLHKLTCIFCCQGDCSIRVLQSCRGKLLGDAFIGLFKIYLLFLINNEQLIYWCRFQFQSKGSYVIFSSLRFFSTQVNLAD